MSNKIKIQRQRERVRERGGEATMRKTLVRVHSFQPFFFSKSKRERERVVAVVVVSRIGFIFFVLFLSFFGLYMFFFDETVLALTELSSRASFFLNNVSFPFKHYSFYLSIE